jgi:hypothetical protein
VLNDCDLSPLTNRTGGRLGAASAAMRTAASGESRVRDFKDAFMSLPLCLCLYASLRKHVLALRNPADRTQFCDQPRQLLCRQALVGDPARERHLAVGHQVGKCCGE